MLPRVLMRPHVTGEVIGTLIDPSTEVADMACAYGRRRGRVCLCSFRPRFVLAMFGLGLGLGQTLSGPGCRRC